MEETGCTLKDLSFLFCQFPNNGISDMKVHIFGAYVENETMEFDENEVQTKKWVCMLRTNEIQCGVSTSALLYAINFWLPKI